MARKRRSIGPAGGSARRLVVVWLLAAAMLAGCAGQADRQLAGPGGGHPGDPYEATNRELLESNLWTYDGVVAPAVEGYRAAVPEAVRAGLSNAIDNLAEPRVFFNDLLQGELERAAVSLARFAVNSTIGFGGLFDRASQMGLEAHDEDFGQTLAVYGVEPGPYLVLPLIGPSNPRDAFGRLFDMALDPANYLLVPVSMAANVMGTTLDRFARNPERLEGLRATSLDFYATLRDAYLQNRSYEIANGAPADPLAGDGGPLLADDPLDEAFESLLDQDPGEATLEPSSGQHPSSRGRSSLPLAGL